MSSTARDGRHDPVKPDRGRRENAKRRAAGMTLVRLWVPDPAAAGFQEEAERQARTLRGAAEENEALGFIEAVADLDDWKG